MADNRGIYEMDLHEQVELAPTNITIARVPGGWLYTRYAWDTSNDAMSHSSSAFVPWHNEFQLKCKGCVNLIMSPFEPPCSVCLGQNHWQAKE